MNSIYVYTHLGLGDQITCHGIIRTMAEQYDRVYVFTKSRNAKNVSFMFRDDPRIRLILMDDAEVRSFISFNPNNRYLIVGHEAYTRIANNPKNELKIDEIFYQLAEVPFENKFSKFKLVRDKEREEKCFEFYKIKGPYVFIHDKIEHPININSNLRIIRPDNQEFLLFDYLKIIEMAQEVHIITSSFHCLLDAIQLKHPNLTLHINKNELIYVMTGPK